MGACPGCRRSSPAARHRCRAGRARAPGPLVPEPDLGVRPVTERLERRGPAAAERHLRQRGQRRPSQLTIRSALVTRYGPLRAARTARELRPGSPAARPADFGRSPRRRQAQGGRRDPATPQSLPAARWKPGLRPQHGGFPRQVHRRSRGERADSPSPLPLGAARRPPGAPPRPAPAAQSPTDAARRRVPKQIPIRFLLAWHPPARSPAAPSQRPRSPGDGERPAGCQPPS